MKKVLIGLSVTINVLVLGFALLLWSGVAMEFLVKKFLGPSHDRWVSQFEVLPVQPGDTVFLGDSITEGGSWHELFPDTAIRNRGIGGDDTRGVIARVEQVAAGKPEQVFMLIGTNDLSSDVPEQKIVANINQIIDDVHALSPATDVFVHSVLPRAADYREQIESLNKAINASINGKAQWVDIYPLFLDANDGSILNRYSNDELHLTGEGYLAWRDAIAPLVNTGR